MSPSKEQHYEEKVMPDGNHIPPFPDDLPTADISTVDFARLAAGDADQARCLHEAATGYGFFYVTNHDVDYSFMFKLAQAVFDLPLEEKMKYDMGTTGHYYGYKRSGAMFVDDKGTRDHSEFYNVSKDEVLGIQQPGRKPPQPTPHPEVVKERFDQLQVFMKSCHQVVQVIAESLGRSLGLPEGLIESMHRIDQPSCCQARVTHAPPVRPASTITLGEHTDFGSVTVLFNQLGGLQVLAPNKQDWEYVKPRPECAVINLGDSLFQLLPKLYSAVHRVVGPPGEQGKCERHSVVYFSRPNSSVKLRSLFEYPTEDSINGMDLMNADDWVKQRARNWNTNNYKDKTSYALSRGTEHNRDLPVLDKPSKEVEAV